MTLPRLKYLGGDPALDLVNTVDWTAAGLRTGSERLPSYRRFLEWAEGAGVVSAAAAARLRGLARRRPHGAAAALHTVHDARAILQRVLGARAAGRQPAARDLALLNVLLADALGRLQLASPKGRDPELEWRGLSRELMGPLWPVVWSGARLLTSDEADRLRICAGDDCGWMYVDRSRNGLRRWCEMATCGTREKNRRRANAS
ncbi:MAG TPA: ABATE domain-containing protein [Gemmatimonadales bacterium]|nr:ABATE domain-containing protein [Gemmatimonadales bacterium]